MVLMKIINNRLQEKGYLLSQTNRMILKKLYVGFIMEKNNTNLKYVSEKN